MSNPSQFQTCCNRRQWIGITAGALTAFPVWAGQGRTKGEHSAQPVLVSELSPEEKESAKNSRLVGHALQLRREGGYNCAELILSAALKCYDLPQATSAAAAAFGGGVGHGELCGFLTGASMALGALASKNGGGRAEVRKRVQTWNDAWWKWWQSLAPLDCRDLRPHYDKAGFENMLIRVCLQVERTVELSSASSGR